MRAGQVQDGQAEEPIGLHRLTDGEVVAVEDPVARLDGCGSDTASAQVRPRQLEHAPLTEHTPGEHPVEPVLLGVRPDDEVDVAAGALAHEIDGQRVDDLTVGDRHEAHQQIRMPAQQGLGTAVIVEHLRVQRILCGKDAIDVHGAQSVDITAAHAEQIQGRSR